VFEQYQRWQLELERRPIEFLGRRHDALLDHARARLAEYVNCDVDNIVYVLNATAGINVVARSLPLQPGDEILTTNHEYGACNYAWEFACKQTGARYIQQPITLPVTTHEAFIEDFWRGVTPRTKVIYISHVSSPTALTFPITEICHRARQAGIITVIDGAHAPGQIRVDLKALDADFYSGNCHKWLNSPKGAGFLFARPEFHRILQPTIISWGYSEDASFVSKIQKQGTRDISAHLSVPAAIDFQREYDWVTVRHDCHALASELRAQLAELTNLEPICPDSEEWYTQMFTAPLPPCKTEDVKTRLYDEFHVEVPLVVWNEKPHVRVSLQGYNTPQDAQALVRALETILY
jgi:isopenicillin-N epimerase